MSKNIESKPYYTLDEVEDMHLGKIGTPRRDEYELKFRLELLDYFNKELKKLKRKKRKKRYLMRLNDTLELLVETQNYLWDSKKSLSPDRYAKFKRKLTRKRKKIICK